MKNCQHLPPEGTLKAVITTLAQSERSAADATLLTVHVARFACVVSVGEVKAPVSRQARVVKATRDCMSIKRSQ